MQRMTRLDGLRGLLAVYVMVGHAMPFVLVPGWVAAPFFHGEAAVDLFFCLSGLVVVQSMERFRYAPGPFLKARARRLLPVYFVVLAGAIVLDWMGSPLRDMGWVLPGSSGYKIWGGEPPARFGWHLLAHLTLTQGLIPQGALPWASVTLLAPAWSLSTEWQFYVLVACLRGRLTLLAALLLAMAVAYRLLAPELPPYWTFDKAFLPGAAGYFALGVASAVWLRGLGAGVFVVVMLGVCGLGLCSGEPGKVLTPVAWAVVMAGEKWPGWAGGLVSKVMGYVPSPLRGGGSNPSYEVTGVLDRRVLQWLGRISYPIYLLNVPVQFGCAMLAAPLAHGDEALFTRLWLPLADIMPVLAAVVLHKMVEVPGMRPEARTRWMASARGASQ